MFSVSQQMEILVSTAVYDNEFLMYCLLSKVCSVGLCGGVVLSEGQTVMNDNRKLIGYTYVYKQSNTAVYSGISY
jgi:hypothetical protein